jgi:hypothetical protein
MLVAVLKDMCCFEVFGVDRRIIWKFTVKKQGVRCGLDMANAR